VIERAAPRQAPRVARLTTLLVLPLVVTGSGLAAVAASAPPSTAPPMLPAPSASQAGPAAASAPLDRFLDGLKTWHADFSQSLTDSRGRQVDAVRGSLTVSRPGRFRWEARPAAAPSDAPAQVMVADGRNVWFYDGDLEQVTVKPAGNALTATPAMLLSGGLDLKANFEFAALQRADGLDWVRVRPRRADAEFREARLGFVGGDLRRMELADRLGQTAVVDFGRSRRNAPVEAGQLRFEPPPGVDVIGKPAA
jgi:outer membrane lipoprotein carrier protein